MKDYTPFLLYQIARFGALTVPQMLEVCQGKCKKSALYRTLAILVENKRVLPLLSPETRTRVYYATREGRRSVFGSELPGTVGIKVTEIDHTVAVTNTLFELSRYTNVTGVATPFEMHPDEIRKFCYERVPDGIVRVTQNGSDFEFAVEFEASVKATDRARDVLNRYWQTFRRSMECKGVLIVAASPLILRRYQRALQELPPECSERIRLLEGIGLNGINPMAFGKREKAISTVLELTRNSDTGFLRYTPVKSEHFLAYAANTVHTPRGSGPHIDLEVKI